MKDHGDPNGYDDAGPSTDGAPARSGAFPGEAREVEGSDRGWTAAAHLSGIVTSVIGPFVVLRTGGRHSRFVRDQAVEALNFQFTVLGALVASLVLLATFVGLPLLVIVLVGAIVLPVVGAVRASQGVAWRYPVALKAVR